MKTWDRTAGGSPMPLQVGAGESVGGDGGFNRSKALKLRPPPFYNGPKGDYTKSEPENYWSIRHGRVSPEIFRQGVTRAREPRSGNTLSSNLSSSTNVESFEITNALQTQTFLRKESVSSLGDEVAENNSWRPSDITRQGESGLPAKHEAWSDRDQGAELGSPPLGIQSRPDHVPKLAKNYSRLDRTPVPASMTFTTVTGHRFATSANGSPTTRFHLPLRTATSIPNMGDNRTEDRGVGMALRGSHRYNASSDSHRSPPSSRESGQAEVRASVRSVVTSSSSYVDTTATERSSVVTIASSSTDLDQLHDPWQKTRGVGMSVEDAISLYAEGFYDSGTDDEEYQQHSMQSSYLGRRESRDGGPSRTTAPPQAATAAQLIEPPSHEKSVLVHGSRESMSSAQALSAQPSLRPSTPRQLSPVSPAPRDRYGFKKASQYVTAEQYDTWNSSYTEYLERRRKKWVALMKQNGLPTVNPIKFPARSDKVKRYIRKGFPPEWRGAGWFWYAGGPARVAEAPGLYRNLVHQAENGRIGEDDREHIERDLNRTFPDNSRFKPDPTEAVDDWGNASGGSSSHITAAAPDVPIIAALRRVLQAFAIHNPKVGYCQSLNFIAGLLLLFLDGDEEKAFIMLDIITTTHLPGTHGVSLEGANVDIGVLMTAIRDSMPAVWMKINVQQDGMTDPRQAGDVIGTHLPTVSLATTAWFMSCFIGTLPMETVLRVWDALFYEGSKTLFRIALAIFRVGQSEICRVNDPLEVFQVVQTIPRRLIDANALMEACFRRRNGFGHLTQKTIDAKRAQRRLMYADEMGRLASVDAVEQRPNGATKQAAVRRAASRTRLQRFRSGRAVAGTVNI